jgi:hypothetical protein
LKKRKNYARLTLLLQDLTDLTTTVEKKLANGRPSNVVIADYIAVQLMNIALFHLHIHFSLEKHEHVKCGILSIRTKLLTWLVLEISRLSSLGMVYLLFAYSVDCSI